MNGKQLCLWFTLFVLLLHNSVGQDEEDEKDTTDMALDVDVTTAHVMPSETEPAVESAPKPAAEPAPEPAVAPAVEPAADPAPESASEQAPESASKPPSEPAAESAPEPADEPADEPAPVESLPPPAPEPEPETAAEAEAEPVAGPQPEHEPSLKEMEATPTIPEDADYQNDERSKDTPENPTQKPIPEAPMPTKPIPVVETNTGINCYSCSSYQKGKCDEKPTDKMPCRASSKNGCYTLIKRDTKLIMRGCISELSEEGDNYCRKEPKLCKMCYDKLCNKEQAPPVGAGSARILGSLLIWIPCIFALI